MNDAYIETIEKLQSQGLETLKQAQAAQIAAVNSIREFVSNATNKIPGAQGLGAIPTVVSQVNELNASYAMKLIEQQNQYMTELVGLFKSAVQKDAPAADKTAETV